MVRALGAAPGHATPERSRDDRDGPSPLSDDVRCPCRDDQGGTAETMRFAPEPGGAFSFFKGCVLEAAIFPTSFLLAATARAGPLQPHGAQPGLRRVTF